MKNFTNSNYRLKRFEMFLEIVRRIPDDKLLRILDLGGEPAYWDDKLPLIGRPVHVTTINLHDITPPNETFSCLRGDARDLPQFADNSFDIVHSNSVIEHVGRWNDMKAMAHETRRLAPAYFLQTPYFWFPIEPHYRGVFFHWLPDSLRAKILLRMSLGFVGRCSNLDEAMSRLEGSVLLDKTMMSALFPDAQIVFEKVYGVPKSIMAIRHHR
jgi:hypothetical protein